jgi:hypothetical protein
MPKASANVVTEQKLNSEIGAARIFISSISEKYELPFETVLNLIKEGKETQKEIQIPTSIFLNRNLGVLESLVKYLKEEQKLTYHEIGMLLNRDERVIWVSYNKAIKKVKSRFTIGKPNCWISISVFCKRNSGLLEQLVENMKEEQKLGFSEIAFILNRSNKTIWASYNNLKSREKNG